MYQISPDRLEIPAKKSEVIVKKYMKPEKVGNIYLPPQSLEDHTGTLWEVVRSNLEADLVTGEEMTPGDIVRIQWGAGATALDCEDPADGKAMYLIRAEDIYHRTKNTWSNQQGEVK